MQGSQQCPQQSSASGPGTHSVTRHCQGSILPMGDRASWPVLGWPKVAWKAFPDVVVQAQALHPRVGTVCVCPQTRTTGVQLGPYSLPFGWNQTWASIQSSTAPLSTVAATASGTFNPLCKVLCILQSLYLCSIGPRSVFCLAMDTPCTSNCSPKPLYSWMRTAMPQARDCTRMVWDTLPLSWAIPGPFLVQSSLTAYRPLHSPQHLLESTVANRKLPPVHKGWVAVLEGKPLQDEPHRMCCQFIRHYWGNRSCLSFLH